MVCLGICLTLPLNVFNALKNLSQNKEINESKSQGVVISNYTLIIQNIQANFSGSYSCKATNLEGFGESLPLIIKVKCKYVTVRCCLFM